MDYSIRVAQAESAERKGSVWILEYAGQSLFRIPTAFFYRDPALKQKPARIGLTRDVRRCTHSKPRQMHGLHMQQMVGLDEYESRLLAILLGAMAPHRCSRSCLSGTAGHTAPDQTHIMSLALEMHGRGRERFHKLFRPSRSTANWL